MKVSYEKSLLPENKPKNRYVNIVACKKLVHFLKKNIFPLSLLKPEQQTMLQKNFFRPLLRVLARIALALIAFNRLIAKLKLQLFDEFQESKIFT